MKIRKIGYYLRSLFTLLKELKNPLFLLLFPFIKNRIVYLKNGIVLQVRTALDCLIIKETLFDDTYNVQTLKNVRYVIDIGGGLGEFSIFVAKKHPKAKILAFEPNPLFFSLLKNNIKRNRVKTISALPYAIGSKKSTEHLYIPKEFAKGSFHTSPDRMDQNTQQVNIKPMASYLSKNVDLLKIDCEGAEWDILSHIPAAKWGKIRNIALEYHRHALPTIDKKISTLFKKYGFTFSIKPDPYDINIGYIVATRKQK